MEFGDIKRAELMASGLGLDIMQPINFKPPKTVPLKAISLAVAQKCNLGCSYCYAEQGSFGGNSEHMLPSVAKASIDRLINQSQAGEAVTLAFMGGEPLTNCKTLHASCEYAAQQAAKREVPIGFTMTTNATLIKPEDIALFQKYKFTLTVSIDGLKEENDALRPFLSGKGSFDRLSKNIKALLATENRVFRVLARVTVTPKNTNLPYIMPGLLAMGFDQIMFSPMLSSPSGRDQMQAEDLDKLLDQLILCGEAFYAALEKGKILPLANVTTMLARIHNYKREQYPCGAGGGYMGVSAKGELYACHRFVDDEAGHMGDISSGVDLDKQSSWLAQRNLQSQSPCTTCWARYLCSGSCHYETIKRGRPACDYIRGWAYHCLALYTRISRDHGWALKQLVAD
ncbi:radical SAM protein [Hellea sp.]|nr:radical SAM protein [Hellea sp.]